MSKVVVHFQDLPLLFGYKDKEDIWETCPFYPLLQENKGNQERLTETLERQQVLEPLTGSITFELQESIDIIAQPEQKVAYAIVDQDGELNLSLFRKGNRYSLAGFDGQGNCFLGAPITQQDLIQTWNKKLFCAEFPPSPFEPMVLDARSLQILSVLAGEFQASQPTSPLGDCVLSKQQMVTVLGRLVAEERLETYIRALVTQGILRETEQGYQFSQQATFYFSYLLSDERVHLDIYELEKTLKKSDKTPVSLVFWGKEGTRLCMMPLRNEVDDLLFAVPSQEQLFGLFDGFLAKGKKAKKGLFDLKVPLVFRG